jgi:hypothetical protein
MLSKHINVEGINHFPWEEYYVMWFPKIKTTHIGKLKNWWLGLNT